MNAFKRSTCVRFQPRDKEEDYLEFNSLPYGYCLAPTGNYGGVQPVRIKIIYYLIILI